MEQNNLSVKLRNSFYQVKQDISNIQETQEKQNAYIAENLQRVNSLNEKAVTEEKFNLLRTNVAELNENVKKLLDIEDEIKDLDERTVTKSYFTQQFDQLSDEFDDIKNGLALLNKETITKYQMNELIADLNDEFNKVKSSIEGIRNIKDSITHRELDKRTNSLNSKIEDTRNNIKNLEEKLANRPTRKQLESDYKDLKKELTSVQNDINTNKNKLKEKLDAKEKTEFSKQFNDLNEKLKQKASVADLRGTVNEVNSEFRKMNNYIKNVNAIIQNAASKNELSVATTKINTQLDKFKADLTELKKSAVDKNYVNTQAKQLSDKINGLQESIQNLKKSRVNKSEITSLEKRFEKHTADSDKRLKEAERVIAHDLVKRTDAKKKHDALETSLKDVNSHLTKLDKETMTKKMIEERFDKVQKELKTIKDEQKDIKNNYVRRTLLRSIERYLKRLYRKVNIPVEDTTFKEIESNLPEKKTKKTTKKKSSR